MIAPLPSPGDWDWLKAKLDEAHEFPSGLFGPSRKLDWLRDEVRLHRPELIAFVDSYGEDLLGEAESLLGDSDGFHAPERLFATGDLVGDRYQVKRFLGAGGMGEVYEVEDNHLPGRSSLALKTIRAGLAGTDADFRFEREVRVALQLNHPNICRVFDVGRHGAEDPRLFLTMEMLHGQLLSERLRPKANRTNPLADPDSQETQTVVMPPQPSVMTEAEALPILIQMLSGLSAIHELGIVHRDFKPANVMLVPSENGAIRVVIMDFGLARPQHFDPLEEVTRAGANPGTPAYMDPEQTGASAPSPAADVYAFGVTMHEILTGQRFLGGDPVAALRRAGVSHRLCEVAKGCLEPVRAKRYKSAAEVLAVLDRPLWRRIGGKLLVAGVAAAALLATSLFIAQLLLKDAPPPESARIAYAEGVKSFSSNAPYMAAVHFQEALALAPAYAMARARLALAWQSAGMKGRAREAALAALDPDLQRHADARTRKFCEAVRYRVLGDSSKAVPLFEELARTAPPDEKMMAEIDLARQYEVSSQRLQALPIWKKYQDVAPYALARVAGLETNAQRKQELLNRVAADYRAAHNAEGETDALYLLGIAIWTEDPPKARALFQSVIDRAKVTHDLYSEANANFRLAQLASMTGTVSDAQAYVAAGIELARKGGVELSMATGFGSLATTAMNQKDFALARQYVDEAIRLAKENQDEPTFFAQQNQLAYLDVMDGRFAEAEQEALRVYNYESARGVHYNAAKAAFQLARARREQGKDAAGLDALQKGEAHCKLAAESRQLCEIALADYTLPFSFQSGLYAEAIRYSLSSLAASEHLHIVGAIPYKRSELLESLTQIGRFKEASSLVQLLPDDGLWRPVKTLRVLEIQHKSRPGSVNPSAVESLIASLTDSTDRAVAQVLLIETSFYRLDDAHLRALLTGKYAVLPAGAFRSERLEFRLARASAWLRLRNPAEALAALGNIADFEINPFEAWRANLVAAAAVGPQEKPKWQSAADSDWRRFEGIDGEVAASIRANRKDLAPYIKQESRKGKTQP